MDPIETEYMPLPASPTNPSAKRPPMDQRVVACLVLFFLMIVGTFMVLRDVKSSQEDIEATVATLNDSVTENQTQITTIKENQDAGKERGFILRAGTCLGLMIDNDRFFDMPPYCMEETTTPYYPPQVCEDFLARDRLCGTKFDPDDTTETG